MAASQKDDVNAARWIVQLEFLHTTVFADRAARGIINIDAGFFLGNIQLNPRAFPEDEYPSNNSSKHRYRRRGGGSPSPIKCENDRGGRRHFNKANQYLKSNCQRRQFYGFKTRGWFY